MMMSVCLLRNVFGLCWKLSGDLVIVMISLLVSFSSFSVVLCVSLSSVLLFRYMMCLGNCCMCVVSCDVWLCSSVCVVLVSGLIGMLVMLNV